MSQEYDSYLHEHVENVHKGLIWMLENLSMIDQEAIHQALYPGFAHDTSKWTNEEYSAYDAYFYGGNRSHKVVQDFNYAWLHHIHSNPHHWQYWVLINDDEKDGTVALEMSLQYVYEMIADWWSFSWKSGNLEEIFDWYEKHRERIIFHEKTKQIVEKILDDIKTKIAKQKSTDETTTEKEEGI